MDSEIKKVLDKLEKQSALEKTKQLEIPSEDRMLAITTDTGKLLNMLLRIAGAQNVLEIGMSTGYSTIWMAEAIRKNNGKVITVEKNSKKILRAKENFVSAGLTDIIEIKHGIAKEILTEMSNKEFGNYFDLVFMDADKEECINYFDLVLPMVKKNGLIVTDNMLFPEKYRPEMQEFHEYVEKNHNVVSVTVPIGNGEELTIKTDE